MRILQSPPNVKQSASNRKEVMDLQAELLQGCWFRVNHADLLDQVALGTPALLKRPIRRSFVGRQPEQAPRSKRQVCQGSEVRVQGSWRWYHRRANQSRQY